MNHTTIKQIQEALNVVKGGICRAQMLFRDEATDPGYELFRKLSQAHSDVEAYISNREFFERTNCLEARARDFTKWIKDNPTATQESIIKSMNAHFDLAVPVNG